MHTPSSVVRLLRTFNDKPRLLVFYPKLASPEDGLPSCWVANRLPYEHEVRWCSFPSLVSKESHNPR
jgi:hypothetical protein